MTQYESLDPTLKEKKRLLIDFIARTSLFEAKCNQFVWPDEYASSKIVEILALVELSLGTINDTLRDIGGLACMLDFPNGAGERPYTLAAWNGQDEKGFMLWSVKELAPTKLLSLPGPELISELRALHS